MMMLAAVSGLALAYSAMTGLCQGLDRHYRPVWGMAATARRYRLLRGAGWMAVLASLLCMAAAWGWAMGAVAWLGALSLAGVTLALLLAYWPKAAVASAAAGPVLAVGMLLQWAVG